MTPISSSTIPNLNQFYMADLMTAPMLLIKLALMWLMYKSRAANAAITVVSVIACVVFWFGIRQQVAIADE
jgi:hypothetical protein